MNSKIKYILIVMFAILFIVGVAYLLHEVEAIGKFFLSIIFATLLGGTI